jgi:hypothetical protein
VAGRVSGPLPKGVLQQFEDDQVARGHQPLVGGQFRLQAILPQSGHHFLGYPIDAFPEVRSCRIERQTVNVDGWRKSVPATGIGACAIFAPAAGSASSPLVCSGAFPQFGPSSKADCIVRCSCIKTG